VTPPVGGIGDPVRTVGRVGITQRQVRVEDRGELRDCLDTRLASLVWRLGRAPVPLSNAVADEDRGTEAAEDYLSALALDAIILSGGDDVGHPPARDRMERAALRFAARGGLPVLGICRGLQVMHVVSGGRLEAVGGHVATRHVVEGPTVARREVNSFHHWGIGAGASMPEFEPLAWAEDGTVEAMRHRRLPWVGMMWHPEREEPLVAEDLAMVAAALSGVRE
jgi:gamma-glutamyl-gamma-aminobutyrate hydrolase PuuD